MKNNIEKVLDILAPIRDFRFGCTKPGWLSNDLMELMKDRNRALKKAAKNKIDLDKKKCQNYWELSKSIYKNGQIRLYPRTTC